MNKNSVVSEDVLKELKQCESRGNFMSDLIKASHLGGFAEEYGLGDGDYIEVSLDTNTGLINVITIDEYGEKLLVDKRTKFYKEVSSWVDIDVLVNDHEFQLVLSEDINQEVLQNIGCEDIEKFDYYMYPAATKISEDIKSVLLSHHEMCELTAGIQDSGNDSNILQELFDGFTNYITSYQALLDDSFALNQELSKQLECRSNQYTEESLDEMRFVMKHLAVVLHTKSLYDNILANYDLFSRRASGSSGEKIDLVQSGKIADAFNAAGDEINRIKCFFASYISFLRRYPVDGCVF